MVLLGADPRGDSHESLLESHIERMYAVGMESFLPAREYVSF